jgi:hypothetical protein
MAHRAHGTHGTSPITALAHLFPRSSLFTLTQPYLLLVTTLAHLTSHVTQGAWVTPSQEEDSQGVCAGEW